MGSNGSSTNLFHRHRRKLTVALVLGSSLIAFVIGECAVRLMFPEIGWVQVRDPGLGWSTEEYRRFSPQQDAGDSRRRVLFLGDSFLAGSGVKKRANRFPRVWGKAHKKEVRTAIFAAGGWGNDQQLLAFKEKGVAWKPDLVVLAFCSNNDISNNYSNGSPKKPKPYFTIVDGRLQLYDAWGTLQSLDHVGLGGGDTVDPQGVRSYLVDLVKHVLRGTEEPVQDTGAPQGFERVDPNYLVWAGRVERRKEICDRSPKLRWSPQSGVNHISAYLAGSYAYNESQWELTEAILRRLNEEVSSIGARFAILLLPVPLNPRDMDSVVGGPFEHRAETPDGPVVVRTDVPRTRLKAIAERIGAGWLDPTEAFRQHVIDNDAMEEYFPKPDNRHFADPGHVFIAEWFEGRIDKLLPTD